MRYKTTRKLRSATDTTREYEPGDVLSEEDVQRIKEIQRFDYLTKQGVLVPAEEDGTEPAGEILTDVGSEPEPEEDDED